jgi:acetylglutamate kinase
MKQFVDSQLRLDLLREALPYIQRFKGKTFVVKFSGKVTEDRDRLASLCEELALLHQVGIRICVIHGGGKQLTELAEKMGVEQTIIEGRRVTDDETLEMAKMIFAGKINTDILAALRHRGVHAVGLSGVDGNIVHAERRPPKQIRNRETGLSAQVDFGNVGDILEIDSSLLTVLLDHGYLPVVSSLGADAEGVDLDRCLGTQRAGDDRALRVLLGLLRGELPAAHELTHERVVVGELLELAVTHAVGARVADVGEGDLAVAHVGRGEGRAHARALGVRRRPLVNPVVGLARQVGQTGLRRDAVWHAAVERFHHDARRHLAPAGAPHAVRDGEQGRLRERAVLVGPAFAAGVAELDEVDGANDHWR